jgi:hypothetical protein
MLTLVISLSEVPVTSLSNIIWINGEQCTIDIGGSIPEPDAPGPGFDPVTEYDKLDNDDYGHQYAWVRFYDGSQTSADTYLTDTFGSDPYKPWTDDMIGRGCAYAIVVCRYSAKGIWSGIPQFKFVLKGIPLYDISKDTSMGGSGSQRWDDTSTWAWSENPKVMIYNIIMGIRYGDDWIYGGQDVSQYQLPAAYWLSAISHCNETVHKDSTDEDLKRYTAGCEISVDQAPLDVIKELDKCAAGYTAEFGGSWKTWSGPPGTSVYSFDDSEIIITEEQSDTLFKADTYCGVRATYTKPQEGWVSKECAPLILDDLLTEDDNIQQIAELQLPFVTESNQVQRLQRLLVKDSRRQIVHNLQLPPTAFILEPFDTVTWSSARNGYDNKKFQVVQIDDLPNCNQQVTLREIDPSDYDWDTEFELPDTVGPIKPVKPGALALDFTVSPTQIDRPGGGKDKPAILVEWDWGLPDVDLKWIKWEVRKSASEPDVIAHGIFHNTQDDSRKLVSPSFRFKRDYQVRLFAQPERTWRGSSWTAWKDVTTVDIDIPDAPSLTRVSELADDGTLDFYIDVDWTKVNADVKYDLQIDDGSKTFFRHPGEENSFRLAVTSGKTYEVWVRAVAEDGGTVGDWSSSASITITKKNTAPSAPTSLTLVADFHKLILDWNKSPDKDWGGVNIYRSNTNDFTAASIVHRTTATGWTDEGLGNLVTKYYWITFVDRSGNESAKYPASNTAGVNGTTTAITDSDTDGTGPATPTSLAVTQRTVLNGDGKVEVQLVVTFTGIANKKATYVVRVDDGTDFDYFDVKDIGTGTATMHRKKIVGVSGVSYSISVAAVSGQGVVGSYTSNVNITASKKATAPTAPTSLGVVANHKRVLVKSNKSPDSDFAALIVYGSDTNDFTTATEAGRVHSTRFIDDGLDNGEARYYWITFLDRSGNESAKYPSSDTAGVSATAPRIFDDDTDPTALAAPSGLALAQAAKDVDEDGKVDIAITATWSTLSGAKSYEFEVTEAGTVIDNLKASALKKSFKAKSAILYSVRIRALSFNGTPGAWSSAVTLTPSKKSTAPSTATWRGFNPINAKPKGITLRWTKPSDADYLETIVYRNTINDSSTASEVDRVSGTTYRDDENLTAGSTYYYWLKHVDRSGNLSSAFSSAQSAAWVLVQSADTDQTALSAPSGLVLTQASKDVDEDGKVDIAITASWSFLTGAKSYELEITEAGTIIDNVKASAFKKTFKAKSNKLYSVRIRAFSFNGTPGSYSSAVTLTPGKKSAAPSTAAWRPFNPINAKPKGIALRWLAATDADYAATVISRNTVNDSSTASEVDRVDGTTYRDDENLTAGSTYYYWLKHVDTSGNLSSSFSSVQSATWNLVQTADIGTGQITDTLTAQTAPSTASAPTVTQVAKDLNGDGTVDMALKLTGVLPSGAKSLEFEVDFDASGSHDLQYFRAKGLTTRVGPVIAGKLYSVKVRGISFNEVAGALSSATTITPSAKTTGPADPTNVASLGGDHPFEIGVKWDKPPEPDYDHSDIAARSTTGTPTNAQIIATTQRNNVSIFRPSVSSEFIYVRHVNRSGIASNWVLLSALSIRSNFVSVDYIDANAITEYTEANTPADQSLTGGVERVIDSATVDCTDAQVVRIDIEFRNNDGSFGRLFTIKLKNTTTNTVIRTWTSYQVNDQAHFHGVCYDGAPDAGNNSYELRLTCPSNTTCNDFGIFPFVFRR